MAVHFSTPVLAIGCTFALSIPVVAVGVGFAWRAWRDSKK
jgi:hypothetical protein